MHLRVQIWFDLQEENKLLRRFSKAKKRITFQKKENKSSSLIGKQWEKLSALNFSILREKNVRLENYLPVCCVRLMAVRRLSCLAQSNISSLISFQCKWVCLCTSSRQQQHFFGGGNNLALGNEKEAEKAEDWQTKLPDKWHRELWQRRRSKSCARKKNGCAPKLRRQAERWYDQKGGQPNKK